MPDARLFSRVVLLCGQCPNMSRLWAKSTGYCEVAESPNDETEIGEMDEPHDFCPLPKAENCRVKEPK